MNSKRRIIITTVLGAVCGGICCWLNSARVAELQTAQVLIIFVSRTLMGYAIGVSTLRMGWWLHSLLAGILFSLPLSILHFGQPYDGPGLLFGFMLLGIVYAVLIEIITTFVFKEKRGGDIIMEESPETQLVLITIKEGYLEYDEPYLQVHPGDTIKWSCAHPFVVRFDVDSPMEKEWQRGGSGIYATDVIRREAPYGRYKYFVAVWDGSQILTDDPELIVRRRTPDPGREKS